ncbi:uncharacterized protein C3orf84 isoform X2 [Lepisosteus oculatus]|uniref:Linkage group 5 C3orf84 homolog n=1 Tax=Lepisosteus oculatus TaxID=7918 RepID=W5N682_LEPOC|nr:PREDICTED: uncharacterized protein C3orf84 homolog isoform X2 [Lepisosteus oculatus]
MPRDLAGSWFPTGYHGHTRSKSRNDFLQEYRLAARPCPPERLIQRLRENPRKHSFSKHDNRHVFQGNAVYFESGLGTRRVKTAIAEGANFKPDLIAWAPLKEELAKAGPAHSTYRASYWHAQPPAAHSRFLLPHRLLPAPETYTTTYRHTYSHCQPNPSVLTDMMTGRVVTRPLEKEVTFAYMNGRLEPKTSQPRRPHTSLAPLSVSDCLKWHVTQ